MCGVFDYINKCERIHLNHGRDHSLDKGSWTVEMKKRNQAAAFFDPFASRLKVIE